MCNVLVLVDEIIHLELPCRCLVAVAHPGGARSINLRLTLDKEHVNTTTRKLHLNINLYTSNQQ